jgi:polysaccharide biosynthesis transport protein
LRPTSKAMVNEMVAGADSRAIAGEAPPVRRESDDARVDLRELIAILYRRRTLIIRTTLLFVLAALAYGLFATPLYTASTQLLIDPRERRIISNEVNPEGVAPDGGLALVESQSLVISSDSVLLRAIADAQLDEDPEFGGERNTLFAALSRRILGVVGLDPDAAEGRPELKALRRLKQRLGVKRSDKGFVVDVFVTSEEREKAVRIADAIADAYLRDQAEARAFAARQASISLAARLDDLRARVQDADDRAEHYKAEHNIVGAGGVLVNEQQLSEMNVQLNSARARTAETRARLEQIERLQRAGAEGGAIPEAVASQTIGQLRVQYAELVRQRADLRTRLGPRHPSIAVVEAQARDLRRLIDEELARIAAAARSDAERAAASERALEQALDKLKRQAITTNEALVRLRELEREVEANRGVYQAFLLRTRETGAQQALDASNVRIISRATPPRDKSWPPRLLILAAALAAGLSFGVGGALARDHFDDTLHSRRQVEELSGLPVLSALPQLPPRSGGRRMLFRAASIDTRQAVDAVAKSMAGEITDQPTKHFVTAVRRLRDALRVIEGPRYGRSVLISSPNDGDGKTTVALNLALAAAAGGERVLLVDGDFAGRTLSRILEAGGHAGLSDLLQARTMLNKALVNDARIGLNFLPVGNASGGELVRPMSGDLMQKLVEPARVFDLIVIDGGSVATAPQIRSFAEIVDDIVILVRAGATRRDDLTMTLDALRSNARKIRGVVMTATAGTAV